MAQKQKFGTQNTEWISRMRQRKDYYEIHAVEFNVSIGHIAAQETPI